MKAVLLCVALVAGLTYGLKFPDMKSECETNDDCKATQCCVKNSRWMIASKRRVIAGDIFNSDYMNGGTCVDYVSKGSTCHYLGFTSCGCEPGTKCVYHPSEDAKDFLKPVKLPELKKSKRVMIYRPGNSFCEAA